MIPNGTKEMISYTRLSPTSEHDERGERTCLSAQDGRTFLVAFWLNVQYSRNDVLTPG